MSERGPRGFDYEARHNPEVGHFESAPEERPEWEPEVPRCEARVLRKTIQEEIVTGVFDIVGNRIGLPEWADQPEIIETTINCDACPLREQFESEGMGVAPILDSVIKTNEILQTCPRLVALGYKAGKIPQNLLPSQQ